MKILVISDSHRKTKTAQMVLKYIQKSIDAIIHLGDVVEDAQLLEKTYSKKIYFVSGNCDSSNIAPIESTEIIAGKKIFLTHGHKYNVKFGIDRLCYAALEKESDIVLFGHTHEPHISYYDKMTILNPGSISEPRLTDFPTYGVIDISQTGIVNTSIVEVRGDEFFNLM